jgi:ABC-2 type transport system permease protein
MLAVIKFTFLSRFRSKSFLITTLIMLSLLIVIINIPAMINKFSTQDPIKLGVFPDESPVAAKLVDYYKNIETPDFSIIVLSYSADDETNEKIAREKIGLKEIKGYLRFNNNNELDFPNVTYKSEDPLEFSLKEKLYLAVQTIKLRMDVEEAGLSSEQVAKMQKQPVLDIIQISGEASGKTESEMKMAYVIVYALLFMLYMGVLGYGNMVAMEITTEKSSRVMEIMISSVSPMKQMFGKIIGVCLIGFFQMCVIITVAIINLSLPYNKSLIDKYDLNLSASSPSLIIYFIIFFVGGYLLYATMFAAVGSVVSRTEDVGQVVMPVTSLILVGFMISMYGLTNPNDSIIVILSYVPLFSPMLMFLRIGMATPDFWEIGLSIVLLFISIIGLGWLAAKIYRTGVLLYGKRLSIKELRLAMKSLRVEG